MEHIGFRNVDLSDGLLKKMELKNENATIYAVYEHFLESGRIDAFDCTYKDGDSIKPHFFWDSDVAKWIEGVSYIISKKPNKKLEDIVEKIIDNIEKNQFEDGYFNIYYTVCEPGKRFTNRDKHELYCAGHLIEAAIAYYNATGKDKFLKIMCRYADLIDRIFIKEKTAAFVTPGHEEIELALIKLYKCTKNKNYLNMAEFFINNRGCNDKDSVNFIVANNIYDQSNIPVREMTSAEGHSVRANYLYAAMASLSKEVNDSSLFNACKRIFDNIVNKRMYITGGTGSSGNGEAYTVDYYLPDTKAYSETCAGIGLVYFAHNMLLTDVDSIYSDVIEKVFYNCLPSAVSEDGIKFFYVNPLKIDPVDRIKDVSMKDAYKEKFPINERVKKFNCSCCPPNINRMFSSFGNYIYSTDKNTLYIHQYISSELKNDDISALIKTDYPNSGKVEINVKGVEKLALRIPGWCRNFKINCEYTLKKGYAYINNSGKNIIIDFEVIPKLNMANRKVHSCGGKVALTYGPFVYCMEGIDNGKNLDDILIDKNLNYEISYDKQLECDTITVNGYRHKPNDSLYYDFSSELIPQRIKFIPYYLFANRGVTEMTVWCNVRI
ncbi:MAG: glycoside hydrolase family 127 protein [Ruminococcaceae bacterium]|nr:glycoside hydrolase family 127 protein [Oscillospiraceae bacterium]